MSSRGNQTPRRPLTNYSFRGYPKTDNIVLINRFCIVCGKKLERKYKGSYTNKKGYSYDRWESVTRFLARKTCGNYTDKDGKIKRTKCLREYVIGEGNPNYKGLMPRCKDCGKKITYKNSGKGVRERCQKCFKIWAKKTGYFRNTPQIKKLAEKMKKTKGIHPEALKPYAFKKGRIATNKKYDFCQVAECNKKHLARGMCSKHYYIYWRKLNKKI